MRRFLVVVLMLVFSLTGLFSQKTEIINGYKVTRGERPSVNLSEAPVDAYYTDKIWIKLAPEMEEFIKDDVIHESKVKGVALNTGVESIDKVNAKYGIEKIKPKQYGFYEISPASIKHREKHKAWGFHLWMEVYLPEGTDVIQAVKDYMALKEVDFAEPVYKDKIYMPVSSKEYVPAQEDKVSNPKLTVNDTRYSEQWHYNNTGQEGGTVDCDIDLPEAWDIERGNNQVLVAVQDMGIQLDHPDLGPHVWSGIGYDFQADNSTIEGGDHGCHTAGTISAVSNNNEGVAGIAGGTGSNDGVRLMSVQVYDPSGAGGGNSNLPYLYSADNDAVISQNSWGYTTVGSYDQLVLDGIDYFNANGGGTALDGGLVIFAAGNSDASGLWWPGCYSGAMGVAATDKDDIRSYYSNYDTWVEIAAPGGYTGFTDDPEGVLSCWASSNYGFYQGTSMACPHVSGVAALIISLGHGVFTNQEVRDILNNTTDYIDDINPTYAGMLGSGRLNAYAALQMAESMLYTAPPSAPSLVNPSNSSTIADATPTFDWADNDETSSYTIMIDNNSNFGSPEINEVTTVSEYTSTVTLSEEVYYWKVLATNNIGSSSYSSTWDVTISFPDINLSTAQLNTTAAPEANVSDSFDIENLGNYTLSYTDITPSYSGFLIPGGTYHANDFSSFPGTSYTNTSWVEYNGGARATGSGVTCTLTSPSFDTSASVNPLYLDMTQDFFPRSGNWTKVEYYTGSAWVEVYYGTLDDNTPIHLELPIKSTSTQLRFSAYTTRAQAATGTWDIDNIAVSSEAVPYNWLTINSSTSGTVSVSGSNTINLTCDATGLIDGVYNADIIIDSDDPDEANKTLPVVFTVTASGPTTPAVPMNIITSISGTDLVVDWDVSADATGYDVYSSDDPYGTFTFVTSVGTNQYTVAADQAKLFYYIVATNSTK
ncbi:MAG: S8 family serine peptidase [Candidatus Delongbacteria bacterium]|nr:S8 family serine peptidase [Candidatus Delongbacteria bacterium]